MTYRKQQRTLIRMAKDLDELDLEQMQETLDDAGVNSTFLKKERRVAFVPVLYQLSELISHFRSVKDQVGETLALLEAELAKGEKLTAEMESQAAPNSNTKHRPKATTGRSGASLSREKMRKAG